jgi:hypothetical protein
MSISNKISCSNYVWPQLLEQGIFNSYNLTTIANAFGVLDRKKKDSVALAIARTYIIISYYIIGNLDHPLSNVLEIRSTIKPVS